MPHRYRLCRSSLINQGIQTPRTRSRRHQPQEQEATDHGFLPSVADRPKSTRSPSAEIGYRHFAAEDKCRCPREQSQDNQHSSAHFERPRKSVHGRESVVYSSIGEAPDLLSSVLKKKQPDGYSQNAEKPRRPERGGWLHGRTHWFFPPFGDSPAGLLYTTRESITMEARRTNVKYCEALPRAVCGAFCSPLHSPFRCGLSRHGARNQRPDRESLEWRCERPGLPWRNIPARDSRG